jgi:hypothetical protein
VSVCGVGRRDRENSLLSSWGCWCFVFVFWCVERGIVRAGYELDSPVLSKGEHGYLHDLDHCATMKRLPQFHSYLSRPGSEIKLHCLQSRVRLTPDLLFLYFGTSLWRHMPSTDCHDSRQTVYICWKVFFSCWVSIWQSMDSRQNRPIWRINPFPRLFLYQGRPGFLFSARWDPLSASVIILQARKKKGCVF